MNCPRCGGTVTIYQLDDRESHICGDCEYVGIDVEHGTKPEEVESWDEAMMRFYERFSGATDGETSVGNKPANQQLSAVKRVSGDERDDGESTPGDIEADGSTSVPSEDSDDHSGGASGDEPDNELTPAIIRADSDASRS